MILPRLSGAFFRLTGDRIRRFNKQPFGQVAQSVEQWTENPRVGGSIPPLATNHINGLPADIDDC